MTGPVAYSGPQTVDIVGPLSTVRFPNLCTRCGERPAGALTITKMFRRVPTDSPAYHVFESVRAPFCAACLAAHERERLPVDPRVIRKLRIAWLVRTLPFVIPVVCITFLLVQLVPGLVRRAGWPPDPVELGIAGFLLLFFGGLLLWFLRTILRARHDLVADFQPRPGAAQAHGEPNANYVEVVHAPPGMTCVIPSPPTSAAAAVNFTDDCAQLFEPAKHVFTFANPDVLAHFRAVNADRVWNPESPRARGAATLRRALFAVFIIAAAALVLRELLGF
jgi:hypothetical protein